MGIIMELKETGHVDLDRTDLPEDKAALTMVMKSQMP
jgi:hypothetical protein